MGKVVKDTKEQLTKKIGTYGVIAGVLLVVAIVLLCTVARHGVLMYVAYGIFVLALAFGFIAVCKAIDKKELEKAAAPLEPAPAEPTPADPAPADPTPAPAGSYLADPASETHWTRRKLADVGAEADDRLVAAEEIFSAAEEYADAYSSAKASYEAKLARARARRLITP